MTTPSKPTNDHTETWTAFAAMTASHEIEVVHDIAMHRHIRMARPGERNWSWEVTTWPGGLAISGDIAGGYVFSNKNPDEDSSAQFGYVFSNRFNALDLFHLEEHRFDHFSDGAPSAPFGYWAEKLVGRRTPDCDRAAAYSSSAFLGHVDEILTGLVDDTELSAERATELTAEAALNDHTQESAHEWMRDNEDQFPDSWETDLSDWTDEFILACYCLQATAQAYDTLRKSQQAPDACVVVEGGMVQNDPGIPVFDLDVLEMTEEYPRIENELEDLHTRLIDYTIATRRPLEDQMAGVAIKCQKELDENGSESVRGTVANNDARYLKAFGSGYGLDT